MRSSAAPRPAWCCCQSSASPFLGDPRDRGPLAGKGRTAKRAQDISGEKARQGKRETRTRSAELGPHLAQTVLQEALFDLGGRQGHSGVKFSGRVARAAEPAQVVRQGSVPQMGVLQAG